jgi:hypothetical protein
MDNTNKNLTDSELMKMALLSIQRLKNSGYDREIIYARLEKQGIPDHIAKEALKDINIEKKREVIKEAKFSYNYALIRIGIGVGLAIISMIILPGRVIIPIGLIAGGIIYAAIAKNKME